MQKTILQSSYRNNSINIFICGTNAFSNDVGGKQQSPRNITGDTSIVVNAAPAGSGSVNILVMDTSAFDVQILSALSGVTYTEVSPASFMTVNLTTFDVLYVGSTFQDGSVTVPSQVLTGQDADFHYAYNTILQQQAVFLQNAINWVSPGFMSVTNPGNHQQYPLKNRKSTFQRTSHEK